jgi:two-component system, LytTR family, response regulator LytT
MNAVIIEDEVVAVKNLTAIIHDVAPEINVIGTLDSISAAVSYLRKNVMPDLIFMDIYLADGDSFLIFKEVDISCPVIFTTAYDTYALEAFKVNSIDYLLKPIEPTDVSRALNKLKQLSGSELEQYSRQVSHALGKKKEVTRTLLVSLRDKLIPVPVNQIAYFCIQSDVTIIKTFDEKEWQIDKTLDGIGMTLDPALFFRANRQYIIAHDAIKEVTIWFGNRLSITLKIPTKDRLIISKARVSAFKRWFTFSE